jgi:glycosyltransferase involved in cell wall biosynthesis
MKKHILLISSIYPPQVGGPAVFTSRYSDWLESKSFKVSVVTYTPNKSNHKSKINYITLSKIRLLSFLRFIVAIMVNSNKKSLILANGAFIETFIACFLTRRSYTLKIPGDLVWELSRNRGWTTSPIEIFQKEKMNFFQKFLRIAINISLRRAKCVISPSVQLVDFLKAWGVDDTKIKLVYNCVDPKIFFPMGLSYSNFDLITVCRLVPWKGIEELIDCVIELDLKLAIVGDGPLMPVLMQRELTFLNNVKFFGRIENKNVVTLLNESKIFILNSNFEATSYAIIESKMCGLPILARSNNGSLTLVRNGIDGFVYTPEGSLTLKEAITKLVYDENLIHKFGKESRIDALDRFNQDKNFPKILEYMEF